MAATMTAKQLEVSGEELRFAKAIDLMRANATWRRVCNAAGRVVAYAMPSSEKPGIWYEVTPKSCTCPDATYRKVCCKHMCACQLYVHEQKLAGWKPNQKQGAAA